MIEAPENGETTLSRVGEIHNEMGENSRIVWKIPCALSWCQVRRGQFSFPFLRATMTASPVRLHGLLFLTLPSQESIVPTFTHVFFLPSPEGYMFSTAPVLRCLGMWRWLSLIQALKGSRSKAPQEHICRLWGSKIFEPLFYGCGSDKKSQNGSQWLDWLGCLATLFASIPVYVNIFYIFWICIELVWFIWMRWSHCEVFILRLNLRKRHPDMKSNHGGSTNNTPNNLSCCWWLPFGYLT